MNNLKLEQIAYAQGWVEQQLASMVVDALGDDELRVRMEELLKTYLIVSEGFDAVRRENTKFETTLMMVRGAIQL